MSVLLVNSCIITFVLIRSKYDVVFRCDHVIDLSEETSWDAIIIRVGNHSTLSRGKIQRLPCSKVQHSRTGIE